VIRSGAAIGIGPLQSHRRRRAARTPRVADPAETTLFEVPSSNPETSTPRPFMLLGLPLLAAVTLSSQSQDPPPPPPPAPASRVLATRAGQPPAVDGRADDAVWREAQPLTGFQEARPSEGGRRNLPTAA